MVPTALSEVISYTPMLGTACYITFITGNVGNMKIPCALNAMEMTDSPLGTERGDTVSAIAVSVSSMVTMIVIAIGVVLLVPLQPHPGKPHRSGCHQLYAAGSVRKHGSHQCCQQQVG